MFWVIIWEAKPNNTLEFHLNIKFGKGLFTFSQIKIQNFWRVFCSSHLHLHFIPQIWRVWIIERFSVIVLYGIYINLSVFIDIVWRRVAWIFTRNCFWFHLRKGPIRSRQFSNVFPILIWIVGIFLRKNNASNFIKYMNCDIFENRRSIRISRGSNLR